LWNLKKLKIKNEKLWNGAIKAALPYLLAPTFSAARRSKGDLATPQRID